MKLTDRQILMLLVAAECERRNGSYCLRGSRYRELEAKGLMKSRSVSPQKKLYTLTHEGLATAHRLGQEKLQAGALERARAYIRMGHDLGRITRACVDYFRSRGINAADAERMALEVTHTSMRTREIA